MFSPLIILRPIVLVDSRQGKEELARRAKRAACTLTFMVSDVARLAWSTVERRKYARWEVTNFQRWSASSETANSYVYRSLLFTRTPLARPLISVWRAERVDKQRVSALADGRKINGGGDARSLAAHSRYCSYLFIHCYI